MYGEPEEVRGLFLTSGNGYANTTRAFVEETLRPSWGMFSSLVQDELAVHVWTPFYSVPLTISVSVSVPDCLDDQTAGVCLEIWYCGFSNFLFVLQDSFGYSWLFVFPDEFLYDLTLF